MARINDTTTYPNTTPALADHVIGTDVSDTTNSADGEVVTFPVKDFSGLFFIESQDAASSASLDFTGFDSANYDSYLFVLSNIIPATDAVIFEMRTSADGGSTFDSGASDYAYSQHVATVPSSGVSEWGSNGDDSVALSGNVGVGSDTDEDGWSGEVRVLGPHLTKRTTLTWSGVFESNSGDAGFSSGGGQRLSSATVDAVQFLFSSDNIESGTITMYGLRNS